MELPEQMCLICHARMLNDYFQRVERKPRIYTDSTNKKKSVFIRVICADYYFRFDLHDHLVPVEPPSSRAVSDPVRANVLRLRLRRIALSSRLTKRLSVPVSINSR